MIVLSSTLSALAGLLVGWVWSAQTQDRDYMTGWNAGYIDGLEDASARRP